MITIRSGKLTIPEDERFIGFAGDDSFAEKQFVICDHVAANSTFTLCLRFDDGSVCSAELPSEQVDSDTVLTWVVRREHIKKPGIVTAQLRLEDALAGTTHTTRDFFLVGYSEDDGGSDVDPSDLSRLEERVEEVEAKLPYVSSGGVYIPDEGEDIRVALYGEVYGKSDIDAMLGGVEAQLAVV